MSKQLTSVEKFERAWKAWRERKMMWPSLKEGFLSSRLKSKSFYDELRRKNGQIIGSHDKKHPALADRINADLRFLLRRHDDITPRDFYENKTENKKNR